MIILRKKEKAKKMQVMIIEALLLIILIVITIVVIFNKDLLMVTIIYCAFSFCAMLLYVIMGAPDVAFTEAVIGIISTIYFIISINNIDRWCK